MNDYTITLTDLTVLTGEFNLADIKETLEDIYTKHEGQIREILLRKERFYLVGQKDEGYIFDFRLYVIGDDCSLRIGKYEQDIRDFIHNLSTFGLWY